MLIKNNKNLIISFSIVSIVIISLVIILSKNELTLKDLNIQNDEAFVNLGLKNKSSKKNQFTNLSADELAKKANEIIINTDLLVGNNKTTPKPLTSEQKIQIDSEVAKLEKQIKQLEQDLKQ